MANPHAGEVEVVLDGTPHRAKLTLGALAELEAELGEVGLGPLIGRLTDAASARDIEAILRAGLRGGGLEITRAQMLSASVEGGALGAARLAAQLIARAFA
ncbi:MAG: gene transfer agent family protein [Paracoccaceae bacterium]